MVLCLLALPIFAILGIFSLKYRKLAGESLGCLFRTVTFRKCRSGLDERIKAHTTGTILKFSPKAAKFFYSNYKFITWIVLILFIWSGYASAVGLYNYAQYGNCNGPEESGYCILDPGTGQSETDVHSPEHLVFPELEDNDPVLGQEDAEITIIEYGCYVCPYTKKSEPTIQEVIDHYEGRVNFQFKAFPVARHAHSYEAAHAVSCAFDQGKYHEYRKMLFDNQEDVTEEKFSEFAEALELNMTEFNECMEENIHEDEIAGDTLSGVKAGVSGTPTFFINNRRIVGSKPLKTFISVIDEELQ